MARKPLIEAGSILPSPTESAGLMERVIERDREKAGRVTPQPEQTDQQYDNMTGHITDKLTDGQTNKTTNQQTGQEEGNTADLQTNNHVSQIVGQPTSQSGIRSVIQQTFRQVSQEASQPLKTVTLKLPPDLDRQVERFCFETGRKKQDVVRDALLLYFEAVEEAQQGQ